MPTSSAGYSKGAEQLVPPIERFAIELLGFERLLRGVYAAGGRLQVAAVEAQADEGLAPVAGHQVLSAITAAQAAISNALTHSAGGHRLVEKLGQSLGYDVHAYGDGTKPPEPERILPRPIGSLVDAAG